MYKDYIIKLVKEIIGDKNVVVETPPKKEMGDYSVPCFSFKDDVNKNPLEIANKIKENISDEDGIFASVKTMGPYVNFYLNYDKASNIIKEILDKKSNYGSLNQGHNDALLIEHTSINPNAEPHMGRCRNSLIGDFLANLFKFVGYEVERHYFINDLGKKIALLVIGVEKYGLKTDSFSDILDVYVKISNEAKTDEALEQKSRYLGLDFSQERKIPEYLAEQIERHIDIPYLLQHVTRPLAEEVPPCHKYPPRNLHIVVLRNTESFSFIYAEHLDVLRKMGRVTFLDPEEDTPLPEDTDLLYLPGGYPEKHAARLSETKHCMESIRNYIEQGRRALAECGGMIYLSQGIRFDESPSFVPLCGILPFTVSNRKEERKLSLGYRQFQYKGCYLRGHEFHYTQFFKVEKESLPAAVVQVYDARKQEVSTPIFRYKNLIASYTHLYWGEIDILQLF